MNDIKTGNVVRLKSGGPRMTVKDTNFKGMYETKTECLCQWFVDDDRLMEDAFDPELLEIV